MLSAGPRFPFVLVLAVCGVLGFFGLDLGHISPIQLMVLGSVGSVAVGLVAIRRRRIEDAKERLVSGPRVAPRTCIVVRPLGEPRNQSP